MERLEWKRGKFGEYPGTAPGSKSYFFKQEVRIAKELILKMVGAESAHVLTRARTAPWCTYESHLPGVHKMKGAKKEGRIILYSIEIDPLGKKTALFLGGILLGNSRKVYRTLAGVHKKIGAKE